MTKVKPLNVVWRRKEPPIRFTSVPAPREVESPNGKSQIVFDPPLPLDWIDFGIRTTEDEPTYSDADIITTIGEHLKLRVASTPPQLAQTHYSQWCYMCGHAVEYVDWIVWNYRDLWWSIDEGTIQFDLRGRDKHARFIEVLRLLLRDHPRGANRRRMKVQENSIADELDRHGFEPQEHLVGKAADTLIEWNKNNRHDQIKTWRRALRLTQLSPDDKFSLRDAVLNTFRDVEAAKTNVKIETAPSFARPFVTQDDIEKGRIEEEQQRREDAELSRRNRYLRPYYF